MSHHISYAYRANLHMRHIDIALTILCSAVLGIGAVAASVVVPIPVDDLAGASPVIVEAKVAKVASGLDPETGRIATYVTLDVSYVFRGRLERGPLVLREAGGRFGEVVHDVDAVPVYEPGERVIAFLRPGPDGTLRTAGMAQGRFVLDEATGGLAARRDLSGQGRIVRIPAQWDSYRTAEVEAAVASNPYRTGRGGKRGAAHLPWRTAPPEIDRVLWADEVESRAHLRHDDHSASTESTVGGLPGAGGSTPAFLPMSLSAPTRWQQSDSGAAVVVDVERARDPLGSSAAAVDAIARAAAAWSDVPESRLRVVLGNTNATFTANPSQLSPTSAYPPSNIVLFGDPYDDIDDPIGCYGTLAVGGYWRSVSLGTTVNNRAFYPALRLYVIFNDGFECFLAAGDNLAEVAAHEIGHGLGFGHSPVADAVMRASAYGGRGPRLGDDDRDGAHCHYPHALTLISPNGGEAWKAGEVRTVRWAATAESGPDAGTVALEYSTDGGTTWSRFASNEYNDGVFSWRVPPNPSTATRVRVIRPNRVSPTPTPYPSACSLDASNGNFTILPGTAGAVPDGTSGGPIEVSSEIDGRLTIRWEASCSSGAENYAVYEGSLADLRAGTFAPAPVTCGAGSDLAESFWPASGDRFYLVAPRTSTAEGSLGLDSTGAPRPQSPSACLPREASSTCD